MVRNSYVNTRKQRFDKITKERPREREREKVSMQDYKEASKLFH